MSRECHPERRRSDLRNYHFDAPSPSVSTVSSDPGFHYSMVMAEPLIAAEIVGDGRFQEHFSPRVQNSSRKNITLLFCKLLGPHSVYLVA
jgi:hypothetical protein